MRKWMSFLILLGLAGTLCADEFDGNPATYGDANTTPGVKIRRARNHAGSPEHIYTSDVLNGFYGYGYGATAFESSPGVSIRFKASENWTDSAQGTRITFETTPKLNATAAEVVIIHSDGGIAPYSRTMAQLKASTPTAAGCLYYDSTNNNIVQSTGTTTSFDYSRVSISTAVPIGW